MDIINARNDYIFFGQKHRDACFIDFWLKCSACKKKNSTSFFDKKIAANFFNDYFKLYSNSCGIQHHYEEYKELSLCNKTLPAEIITIIVNQIWIYNISEQIDYIDCGIYGYTPSVDGFRIPNARPPAGMRSVEFGCNYRTGSKSRPGTEHLIELTKKFILSGIILKIFLLNLIFRSLYPTSLIMK
jgi:hypothetical protein